MPFDLHIKSVKSSVRTIFTLLFCFVSCRAFVLQENSVSNRSRNCAPSHQQKYQTLLHAGLFGPKEAVDPQKDSSMLPKRIMEIPVKSIKKGGLRMVIGLCLIGLQNTPDTGSWRANQASNTVLDMIFRDNAAKFSVVLEDSVIAIERYGQASLPYLLQESVILHRVLDELHDLAFNSEVEPENRLLQLEAVNAIEEARSTLPARQA